MNLVKKLRQHQVVAYVILTFLFTWLCWSISFTSSNQSISGVFRIVGSFMPSVVAVTFSACFFGKRGMKELLKKIIVWKISPLYYVFAIFYTAASVFIPSFICTMLGLDYRVYFGTQLAGISLTSPFMVFACFFAVMFFGGPVGEELGWRGFVLPRLQKRFSPITASIIIGVIWSCWHIPMFLVHAEGYDISFIRYLFETIWLAILFTWLYNHTKGSLLIPILFHSVDNFVFALCYRDFMNHFNVYTVIWYAIRFLVLLPIIVDMLRNSSNRLLSEDET